MIRHFFIVIILLFSGRGLSQVEFYLNNGLGYDTLNVLNGTTLNINDNSNFVEISMGCKNTSLDSLDLSIRRKIFTFSWSFISDQLCDNNLCYTPQGDDFIIPVATVLANGEISIVKSSFLFSNTNASIYVRYYALNPTVRAIDKNFLNKKCDSEW